MRITSGLNKIRKFIKLKAKNGHVEVEFRIGRRVVRQLSNVTADLTAFERNAVLIHFYKLFDKIRLESVQVPQLKREIEGTNYAEVFGSPWSLDGAV